MWETDPHTAGSRANVPHEGPGATSQGQPLSAKNLTTESRGPGQGPAWHRGAMKPVSPKLAELRNKGLQRHVASLLSLRQGEGAPQLNTDQLWLPDLPRSYLRLPEPYVPSAGKILRHVGPDPRHHLACAEGGGLTPWSQILATNSPRYTPKW